MTDFLHRLALRTVAPEQLVRPRLPSRFERGGPVSFEEEAFETTAAERPSPSSPGQPRVPAVASLREHEPPPRERTPERAQASAPVPPPVAARGEKSPKPPDPQPRRRAETRTRREVVQQVTAETRLVDVPGPRVAADPVPVEATAATREPETPAAPPPPAERLPADPPAAVHVRTLETRTAAASERVVVRERLPRRERASAAAAAEPTINVSIGRVEVRAVPAPAHQPPTRAAAPAAKPLDEYLREQAEGRR